MSRNAVRKCGETGTWLGKHDDTTSPGWTKYIPCFTPEVQSVFGKMFEDDQMGQDKLDVAQKTGYVEFIGFSTSMVALILSLIIFCSFGSLRNNRTRNHKSLFIAMLLQVIIRLILYSDQEYARTHIDEFQTNDAYTFMIIENIPYLCEATFFLLEYLSLVMFMWMFVEGLYLHNVVTNTSLRERIPFVAYHLLTWGIPVIFTTIWATLTAVHYRQEAITTKAVRAALVLLPLLGITNILNMVEVSVDASFWMFATWYYGTHYLRSFQGYFIALIYCFLNSEVRATIKKHYMNFVAMRSYPHRSRSRRCIGQRYVRLTDTDGDTSWILMTTIRNSNIYSVDDANYDSDSEPSFVPPSTNIPEEENSSDNEGVVMNAGITIVTQAEVHAVR